MPRQNPIEQNVRQQVAFGMNPVGAQVVARPVSQLVTPAYGDALRLTQALASVEPALQQMGEKFLKKQEEQNNFALQMQALDDGAAGKDSAMPDNPVYQSQFLRARTQRELSNYDSKIAKWREENKYNPSANFDEALAGFNKELESVTAKYTGFAGMAAAGAADAASKARTAYNQSQSILQNQQGVVDGLKGVEAQSSNVDYLRGMQHSEAIKAASSGSAEMVNDAMLNSSNPEYDLKGSMMKIREKYLAGLGQISPEAEAVVLTELYKTEQKLIHERGVMQQKQLIQDTVDGHKQGALAILRDPSKNIEEAVSSIELYGDGHNGMVSTAQQRANVLGAVETLAGEDPARALAALDTKNRNGIRLSDTKEGADLKHKISAALEAKARADAKKALDVQKYETNSFYEEKLKTDPAFILQNSESIAAYVAADMLSPEQGVSFKKRALDAHMENLDRQHKRGLINGPMAYHYRTQDEATKKIWIDDENKAAEDMNVSLVPLYSAYNTESDPAKKLAIRNQIQSTVESFTAPRLIDAAAGRGMSPVINEMLKSGRLNPLTEDQSGLSIGMLIASAVFDSVKGKNNPDVMETIDKDTRVFYQSLDAYKKSHGNDMLEALKTLRSDTQNKLLTPAQNALEKGAKYNEKDILAALRPWGTKNSLEAVPVGMVEEVRKIASDIHDTNPSLPADVVMAQAAGVVADSYVLVGKRGYRVPEGAKPEEKKYYQMYYEQKADQYASENKTLDGVTFDSRTNSVVYSYTDESGMKGVDVVARQRFQNEISTATFIDPVHKAQKLKELGTFYRNATEISKLIGLNGFEAPKNLDANALDKFNEDSLQLKTALDAYKEKIKKLPLNERVVELRALNKVIYPEGTIGDLASPMTSYVEGAVAMPIERAFKWLEGPIGWAGQHLMPTSPAKKFGEMVMELTKSVAYETDAQISKNAAASNKPVDPTGFGSVEQSVASGKRGSNIASAQSAKENAALLEASLNNPKTHTPQLAFTGAIEGFRPLPYNDKGGFAIGFGYNITNNKHRAKEDFKAIGRPAAEVDMILNGQPVPPLSRKEAEDLAGIYFRDLKGELISTIGQSKWESLSSNQQIVLTDMAYNFGVPNAKKTAAFNKMVSGNSEGFLYEFSNLASRQTSSVDKNNFRNRLGAYSSMLAAPDAAMGIKRHLGAHQQ